MFIHTRFLFEIGVFQNKPWDVVVFPKGYIYLKYAFYQTDIYDVSLQFTG